MWLAHFLGHFAVGVGVWFIVLLILIPIGVVSLILFAVGGLVYLLTLPFVDILALYNSDTIDEGIERSEAEYLKKYLGEDCVHEHLVRTFAVYVNDEREKAISSVQVQLHILHLPCATRDDAPCILLVHGTAGSSLSFIHVLQTLRETFNVYAVDLPGFGRSHVNRTYKEIARMYENSADFHCNVLERAMDEFGITRKAANHTRGGGAFFCGHSFGGYICSRFVVVHPGRVAGLIMVNPAGVFPTLGGMGVYWAYVFKLSIPNIGRLFGRLGFWFVTKYLFQGSAEALYWYYISAHPRGIGDLFVRERITLSMLSAYWNRPAFNDLAVVSSPVCTIYGEIDSIMPPHQGIVLEQAFGHPLKVVEGRGHNPMDTPKTGKEVALFIAEFARASIPSAPADNKAIIPVMEPTSSTGIEEVNPAITVVPAAITTVPVKDPRSYRSSFSVGKTYSVIRKLYIDIGVQYNVDLSNVDPRLVEEGTKKDERVPDPVVKADDDNEGGATSVRANEEGWGAQYRQTENPASRDPSSVQAIQLQ